MSVMAEVIRSMSIEELIDMEISDFLSEIAWKYSELSMVWSSLLQARIYMYLSASKEGAKEMVGAKEGEMLIEAYTARWSDR